MESENATQETKPVSASGPAAHETLANIPATWPGAWHIYKYSKQAVMRNWKTLLIITLINLVFSAGLDVLLGRPLGMGLSALAGIFFQVAAIIVILAGVRGKEVPPEEAFKSVKLMTCVKYIALIIVMELVLLCSLILLIVPFFFVFPRLLLSQYFLVDKDMGPIESMKASWTASKGNSGKAWGVIGAIFALSLIIITIIGIPFAIYFLFMYSAAAAILFEYLNQNKQVAAPNQQATMPRASATQQ